MHDVGGGFLGSILCILILGSLSEKGVSRKKVKLCHIIYLHMEAFFPPCPQIPFSFTFKTSSSSMSGH